MPEWVAVLGWVLLILTISGIALYFIWREANRRDR